MLSENKKYYILMNMNLLIFFLLLLISISFLTLMERFFLGFSQNRVSVSKFSFFGVLQAVIDGLKLMFLEKLVLNKSLKKLLIFFPLYFFFLVMMSFFLVYYNYNFLLLNYNFLLLIILIGFSIYFLMMMSFFSRSKYSILGSLRSVSQTLSFDILMMFFLMMLIMKNKKMLMEKMMLFFMIIFMMFFLMMILVELNRAPFDFLEGESELVSGYNLELSSVNFIFLFLGEYGLVIFYSYFFSLINNSFFLLFFFMVMVLMVIRSVYPRFRYDYLLSFCWFILLPILLLMFLVFVFLINLF